MSFARFPRPRRRDVASFKEKVSRSHSHFETASEEGVIGFDRIHAFGREAGDREYGRARRIPRNAMDGCDDEAMIAALEETLHVAPCWREGRDRSVHCRRTGGAAGRTRSALTRKGGTARFAPPSGIMSLKPCANGGCPAFMRPSTAERGGMR